MLRLHAQSAYFPWCPWWVSYHWSAEHVLAHRVILHPLILHEAHLDDVRAGHSAHARARAHTHTHSETSIQTHFLSHNFPLHQLSRVYFRMLQMLLD